MKRILIIFSVLFVFSLFSGCGNSQPEEPGIFSTGIAPIPGQWISYGLDEDPGILKISVIGKEKFDGDECYWYQVEYTEFDFKILIDYNGITRANRVMEESWSEFLDDPQNYFRNLAEKGITDVSEGLLYDEASFEQVMEYLEAIKMIVFEENGNLIGYDISGIAEVFESASECPGFFDYTAGTEGFDAGVENGFDIDSIMEIIASVDVTIEDSRVKVSGVSLSATVITLSSESEGFIFEMAFSGEIPICPLLYAHIEMENEEHIVQVRNFGWTGAVDVLPGEPVQIIDVAEIFKLYSGFM